MKSHQKLPPYFDISYDTKERFCSYWHQINEIISLNPKEWVRYSIHIDGCLTQFTPSIVFQEFGGCEGGLERKD